MNGHGRILILGAGPCGLACAYRLNELGHHNWLLAEATSRSGGAAASVVDDRGFSWEFGGHVIFSKIKAFHRLLSDLIPADDLIEHRRSSAIHYRDRMVPYPFQRHLRHLPYQDRAESLHGLLAPRPATGRPHTYADWLTATFGAGLVRQFFEPYNTKVWTVPLEDMSADWVTDRVAPIDWEAVLTDLALDRDPPDWGPNQRFLFPRGGGIGHVWETLAERLRPGKPRFGARSVAVDWKNQLVAFADGTTEPYDTLVSTIPLDILIEQLDNAPESLGRAAAMLRHTKVRVVGLGYEMPTTDDHNWLYFPDPDIPFYRASNPAKNAPANVPGSDTTRYSSWLLEMTGAYAETAADVAVKAGEAGLRAVGLVPPGAEPVSRYTDLIDRAYPVPTLRRDEALEVIQPWLAANRIYSRGRMGAWRYELGNVDHAVQMGSEVADHLVRGAPERLMAAQPPPVGKEHSDPFQRRDEG